MTSQTTLSANEKFFAAIGYLGILCVVPLILERKSAFAQHHGKQGLVLLLAWLALWIGNIVPLLGSIIWFLGSLAILMLIILGMVNAFQGRMWNMPVLGQYARRIKF